MRREISLRMETVSREWIEHSTCGLRIRRSNQLSYRPKNTATPDTTREGRVELGLVFERCRSSESNRILSGFSRALAYRISFSGAEVHAPGRLSTAAGRCKHHSAGRACDEDRTRISGDTTRHLNHSATHAIGMMIRVSMCFVRHRRFSLRLEPAPRSSHPPHVARA